LQEKGKSMRLENSGWTPGVGDSGQGQDPNDGRTIDDVPDDDNANNWDQALIDTLRETRGYHRQACRAINSDVLQLCSRAEGRGR
jgi:hypothetical protein